MRRRDITFGDWFRYIGGAGIFLCQDRQDLVTDVDPTSLGERAMVWRTLYFDKQYDPNLPLAERWGETISADLVKDHVVEVIDEPPDDRDDAEIRFSLLELD